MARKVKDVKAPEIKEPVKVVPVEEAKVPAKTEPKKAGRKPAAKKAALSVKEEKHDIVRLPDALPEGTKLVFDENGKTKIVDVEEQSDKKVTKKSATKKSAEKSAPAEKETKRAVAPAKKSAEKPKKAPVAKKAASAKAAKVVTTSVLQVSGNEFDFDKVVKAVEGLKKKNAGKTLEIYIKPEDRAIYYVVNGKGGKKIDL